MLDDGGDRFGDGELQVVGRVVVQADGLGPVSQLLGEALTLWGMHLVAGVLTPMTCPFPGWTKLSELPSRQLRTSAHRTCDSGLNVPSAALGTLPALTTEVVVRTHVHGRAMVARDSAVLEPAEAALRSELLLAGHALAGTASLG